MIDILNPEEVYNKINELRIKREWSIYMLAKEAGLSSTEIYRWRDNHKLLSIPMLHAVCDAFGISLIDFILDGDELINLTDEQKKLIRLWNTLSAGQKKSIITLMKSM